MTMLSEVAADEGSRPFPTITDDHPHQLRGTVRRRDTGELYVVLGLIIWSADHFDQCDDVIVAPVDDLSNWTTFQEHELEAG